MHSLDSPKTNQLTEVWDGAVGRQIKHISNYPPKETPITSLRYGSIGIGSSPKTSNLNFSSLCSRRCIYK
ncbi:hypothetical protein J6590_004492 [Homalodisca vitripennis]|nr:hypothetical protein J6590_004492 [Homalodisca vitripennis]